MWPHCSGIRAAGLRVDGTTLFVTVAQRGLVRKVKRLVAQVRRGDFCKEGTDSDTNCATLLCAVARQDPGLIELFVDGQEDGLPDSGRLDRLGAGGGFGGVHAAAGGLALDGVRGRHGAERGRAGGHQDGCRLRQMVVGDRQRADDRGPPLLGGGAHKVDGELRVARRRGPARTTTRPTSTPTTLTSSTPRPTAASAGTARTRTTLTSRASSRRVTA
jgi:hypothetical protein